MVRISRLRISWIIALMVILKSWDFVTGVPINQGTKQKYDNGGLLPNSYQGNENSRSQEGRVADEGAISQDTSVKRNNQDGTSQDKPAEQPNFVHNNLPQLDNHPLEEETSLARSNDQPVDGSKFVNNPTENQDVGHEGNPTLSRSNEQPSENRVPQLGDKTLPGSNDQAQNNMDTNTIGNNGQPPQSWNDNGLAQPLHNAHPQPAIEQPQQYYPAQYQNGEGLGLGSDGQPLQNKQENTQPLNSGNNKPVQNPQDVPQVPLSSEPLEGKAEDPSRSQQVNAGSISQGLGGDGNAETTKNVSSVESTLIKLGLSSINDKEQGKFSGPIGIDNQQEGQGQSSDSAQGQKVQEEQVGDKNYAMNWKLQRLAQMKMQGFEGTVSTSTSVVSSSPTSKPTDEPLGGNDESQKEFWEDDNVEDDSDEDGNDETNDDEGKDKQYTEDGYLDAPADNVDNVGRPVDKTDEETNRNSNNYDESSDANQNNQNIMDDNNEQAVYNNGVHQLEGEKDPDEDYHLDKDGDEDEDTYEEKIDQINSDQTTPSSTPDDDDDWYDTDDNEDESDIIGGDDNKDKENGDFEETVVDEEALFNQNHPKRPFTQEEDNPIYFNNMYPKLKEGLVEYKMIQNRGSINAPSSMVLFYTWIILVVLIAVITFSAFRYRCKGMLMNGARNYRNGNHGNFKNGEENKKLLENVYA